MTSELAPAARRSTCASACTSPDNSVPDADVLSGSKTAQALERFLRVLGGHAVQAADELCPDPRERQTRCQENASLTLR